MRRHTDIEREQQPRQSMFKSASLNKTFESDSEDSFKTESIEDDTFETGPRKGQNSFDLPVFRPILQTMGGGPPKLNRTQTTNFTQS